MQISGLYTHVQAQIHTELAHVRINNCVIAYLTNWHLKLMTGAAREGHRQKLILTRGKTIVYTRHVMVRACVCVCASVRHSLRLSKELWPKHKPTTDAEVSAASLGSLLVGSDWLSICLLVRLFALALFIMRQIRVYHRTKANGTMGVALLPQRISCGNLMLFAPSNETIFAYINFIYENHLHTHKYTHTQADAHTRARI